MAEQFQNFFVTKLREACDATATTIYVETVPSITEGTLVLEYANSTKHEIIHFTGVSGYGLTGCTRGLEGTTAQSHSAGVDVRQNLTAGMIDKLINGVITTENIADGAVTADKIDFTTLQDIFYFNFHDSGNYSGTQSSTRYDTVNLPRKIEDNENCLVFATSQDWVVVGGIVIQSNKTQVKVSANCVVNSGWCRYKLSAIYFPTS